MADKDWGLRADGTKKGPGYLGTLSRPDKKVSTELSIGVNFDGKETEIPSLVPTLSQKEIDYLLAGGKPTSAIVGKAVAHARTRMSAGKSPFAGPEDVMAKTKRKSVANPAANKPNMTRAEIDAFINARLRQQATAVPPQPQPTLMQQAQPYGTGIMNLMNVLLGRSPLQQPGMGVKQ